MGCSNARARNWTDLLLVAASCAAAAGPVVAADESGPPVTSAPAVTAPAVAEPAVVASAAPAAAPLAGGKHVAQVVCWACHVVAADQEFPPLLKSPAPAFADIANRPGTTLRTLVTYIRTTHWEKGSAARQMPDPMLTGAQTQAVARYILSLRKQ